VGGDSLQRAHAVDEAWQMSSVRVAHGLRKAMTGALPKWGAIAKEIFSLALTVIYVIENINMF
jgi:hypothetical protein